MGFGKTEYNILNHIERRLPHCPKDIYDRSVAKFQEEGLIGEKHVTEKGYLLDGYDKSIESCLVGGFDISYQPDVQETVREFAQKVSYKANIQPGSVPEELEDAVHVAADLLAEHDPLAQFLPWSDYRSLPMIKSMELITPAGIQSTHCHYGNGMKIIRFFKPEKENYWFDLDVVKNYFFEKFRKIDDKVWKARFGNPDLLTRLWYFFLGGWQHRKAQRYLEKSSALFNPDKVPKLY